jgi:hypothetical protein
MKLNVYSVFDSKAGAYIPPFFMQNDGVARRAFGDAANDVNHKFCAHAEDYTLFRLGTFDDATGVIELEDTHLSLGVAIEYMTPLEVSE